jgi:hypothetical protein
MDKWDDELRTYLFVEGSILEAEEAGDSDSQQLSGLSIGDLK